MLVSLGPALVCGRRGVRDGLLGPYVGLGVLRVDGDVVLALGSGWSDPGVFSRFLRVRRGDFDLLRASEADKWVLEIAKRLSASFVEVMKTSSSSSSYESVLCGVVTII